jgi:predicted amidohydrolase YtcJ
MLIRNAEIEGQRRGDLRIDGTRILAIADKLAPDSPEQIIEAGGGAVFPGLHDHHIHLAAYAAALDSVQCGPPQTVNEDDFAKLLAGLNKENGPWLRGVGYHDSVAGAIGRDFLDRFIPDRPARIQHRSGRLWIFNSAGIEVLNPNTADPLEREAGRLTGRLYDGDVWLRQKLGSHFPNLERVSHELAGYGVTGVTDATASNDQDALVRFDAAQANGELLQSVLVMGDDRLNSNLRAGPRKFHLHEASLPDFDQTVLSISRAHEAQRAAAFHCVTRTDLAFALAALDVAGARPGDRIEHASIAPPELVALMRQLGVAVITQPNFIFERGDRYIAEVPSEDLAWLYPVARLAGIKVAGGTDAPFGSANPWLFMEAAVHRRTRAGLIMGPEERIAPEAALSLFLGTPAEPGGLARRVALGEPADLVVLDRSWQQARQSLADVGVRATLRAGSVIYRA